MPKVLIVDDSVSMRQMVSYTLRSGGHEVVEAENGAEGLAKAKAAAFDLVITDLNMPVMDGIAMIKEIRQIPAMRTRPILMLTTESNQGKKEAGKAAGATGWIVKPFEPNKLLDTVKKVLP